VIDVPDTHYAVVGEDRVAFQVFGDGDLDLLWVPASADCIELRWDWPPYAQFLEWLGARARVIAFDRRGTGASDAPSGDPLPLWEQWADDAQAVLDAVGSERAVITGVADAGPTAVLFAGSQPSRTRGLILINSHAGHLEDDVPAVDDAWRRFVLDAWGTNTLGELVSPDVATRDPRFGPWFAKNQRMYMTPRTASRVITQSVDIRDALPLVRLPTLVLRRENFAPVPIEHAHYLADHIAGARLVIVPGTDGWVFAEPAGEALGAIDEFLGGHPPDPVNDRALAAILFTDIVQSTERAAALGDSAWRNLLTTHDAMARTVVQQHNGRMVKTTGDGVLATFDGPGRAIRCALSLRDALRSIGVDIRAGIHTGEVELIGDDIAGIGVHIAARVLGASQPGEVFVSAVVPMLVAGAGFTFEERGEHELKGVPGTWPLLSAQA
jgi:class 3 adenylate cyclase/pimeloyl-ACP methyl ester carboxylesterase